MIYADLPPAERDRLIAAYGAGLSAGGNGPWMLSDDPETVALIDAINDDWFRRLETWQATERIAWPLLPEWFRAEQERAALDQGRPDDWIRASAQEGRP